MVGGGTVQDQDEPLPPFAPAGPALARLTQAQYANAIRDLFGGPAQQRELQADAQLYLFSVIGDATNSATELGVDLYGRAAYSIGTEVFSDATRRQALVPCAATTPLTDACLTSYIRDFGLRIWRRPLASSEQDRYHKLGVGIGLANPAVALQYVTAAMLQSPNFLYRVEVGEPAPEHPGWLRYTGYEMATRLSFLLRNTIPDSELFAAAARGDLVTSQGILQQANRLLQAAGPTQGMVDQLFTEYLDLGLLDDVVFPTELDPHKTLAASMRGEVLSMVDRIALTEQGDLRNLFATNTTAIDADLAKLYGLPAPTGTGLQRTVLAANGPRAGLLTTGGLLALNNKPYRTAPTRRGLFVRVRMLCSEVPPPPPNIPPIDENAAMGKTFRETLAAHRTNPACSGCHTLMDPVGLGMEDFDRYGRYRTTEDNGLPINDEGDLDGTTFHGARELGHLLATDDRIPACLVKQLYRYASARLETPQEEIVLRQINDAFAQGGHALKPLIVALVGSDGFRYLKSEVP
jgi:hypothetical protein